MTSRDFAYWLNGFFEISGTNKVSEEQIKVVKSHLSLVFKHEIDPSMGDVKHQEDLNKLHHANSSDSDNLGHGNCPHEGWVLHGLHGWYDPKMGRPRC